MMGVIEDACASTFDAHLIISMKRKDYIYE
jgi:hypothetical protein